MAKKVNDSEEMINENVNSENTLGSDGSIQKNLNRNKSNLVTVKLFKDNNKYKDDVFVAVNGVGIIIPRGKEVRIDKKYAEVLRHSEQQNSFAAEYQSKLQDAAEKSELEL